MNNKMKSAIVLGSSRSKGNTSSLVDYVANQMDAQIFDLNHYEIAPYQYEDNPDDDFFLLMDQLLDFDRIVLASPLYWYSASAQMKAFIDRWTELLRGEKDKGRRLRGKHSMLLATGGSPTPPSCFEDVFSMTFNYLGMDYQGMLYCGCPNGFNLPDHQQEIDSKIADIHFA